MAIAAAQPAPLPIVEAPLAECPGEVLARTVHTPIPIPHFDSSAMDGFAVAGPPPWTLENELPTETGSMARAEVPALGAGRARVIVTGGPVPAGASGIVRREYAQATGDRLDLIAGCPDTELETGRHIRRAGRESALGEAVATAGTVLTPAHIAYAAVAGFDTLPVRRRARVAVIQTGDEVRGTGIPAAGEVRDAFGPQLPAYVRLLGGDVVSQVRIGDDAAQTRAAIEAVSGGNAVDLVLTTGGTGRSAADHVRREVEALADEVLFGELDMRPGHPTMFTRLPGAACWQVGLPGNPLAAMVAMRVVVQPFMRTLRGLPPEVIETVRLADGAPGARVQRLTPARRSGRPGVTLGDAGAAGTDQTGAASGAWELCDKTGPNMLRGLSHADGLVVLPASPVAPRGSVSCLRLPWTT
nr:molybdopterin molybdotransferase MoeA [Brevibacterium daeguense]